MPKFATQIYLPNEGSVDAYRTALGMSEKESQFLGAMDKAKHHILIKRDEEITVLELPLPDMPPWQETLHASADALTRLGRTACHRLTG